ncbi:MAG: TldD/PmbA family protein [Bacteroidales bacterium]|nr:TldD/PmbA family protein [Bacteroidales bacterium]
MNLNRRTFIKTGSSAVAGVMLLPSLAGSCSSAVISENVKEYLDHFGVTPEILRKIVSVAMSRGGDYADLFFEHKISNALALQDGTVNRAFSNIDYGVGIRVLKGDQTGFAYSESVNEKSMSDAALMAANIASSGNSFSASPLTEKAPASFYELKKRWEDVSVGEKVPFLQMLNDRVFSLDSKVVKVSASINDETSRIMFYNSEGMLSWDYRPLVSMSVVCIMQKGSQIENSYSSRSFRTGFEWISESLVDELSAEVVNNTNLLFDAVKPRAGEMPVVMGAGGSGILLHEAIGHTFEADFNRKGTSIFSDKMGKKVAADFVNIIDDGTLLNNRGSLNIDDEGNEVQKTYLVKDGVLNSYIHDRISAAYYGVNPTGNGRRQDFRNMPLPRMRATYMEAGPFTREEIFNNIDYGVYVDQFSNGEVKIGAGDFTFFAKSGYLIEKGKLTQPIKDINIIGNGPQALADITMAADDYLIDNSTWSCGKDGQTVPVTCGLPSILVKKLTVGGTN